MMETFMEVGLSREAAEAKALEAFPIEDDIVAPPEISSVSSDVVVCRTKADIFMQAVAHGSELLKENTTQMSRKVFAWERYKVRVRANAEKDTVYLHIFSDGVEAYGYKPIVVAFNASAREKGRLSNLLMTSMRSLMPPDPLTMYPATSEKDPRVLRMDEEDVEFRDGSGRSMKIVGDRTENAL